MKSCNAHVREDVEAIGMPAAIAKVVMNGGTQYRCW